MSACWRSQRRRRRFCSSCAAFGHDALRVSEGRPRGAKPTATTLRSPPCAQRACMLVVGEKQVIIPRKCTSRARRRSPHPTRNACGSWTSAVPALKPRPWPARELALSKRLLHCRVGTRHTRRLAPRCRRPRRLLLPLTPARCSAGTCPARASSPRACMALAQRSAASTLASSPASDAPASAAPPLLPGALGPASAMAAATIRCVGALGRVRARSGATECLLCGEPRRPSRAPQQHLLCATQA